jgi:tRNA modification GTPase
MSQVRRQSLDLGDTVFALASGSLPCAVAILRLSGPGAFAFAEKHFRPVSGAWKPLRGMLFGVIIDAEGREIDSGLLLTFVGPHSFTGQNVLEIQCHGSVAIVSQIESLFVQLGFRPAERGEFSFRAFHGNKLSPNALEALGDVFLARQPADLGRIYGRRDSSLDKEIEAARENLIALQAILDTAVDFSEEYASAVHLAEPKILAARSRCDEIAKRYEVFKSGEQIPRLVLAGRPNAGKSSLFNALLCRYRAIVHEAAGTTRDVIEEDIELAGRRWKLVDTAGIRDASNEAERQGIELGTDFLGAAEFWILVVDGTLGLSDLETGLLSRFGWKPHLIVWNKSDLAGYLPLPCAYAENSLSISAQQGESVRYLAAALEKRVPSPAFSSLSLPTSVQARHLRQSVEELERMQQELYRGVPPEVIGELNRGVLRRLEAIVGEVDVEQVLDRVFSEFCIGK